MKSIEFEAMFGNEVKKVRLVANDYGGGGFQILINKFFHGSIYKKEDQWLAWLNERSDLTSDDITALGERIDEYNKSG